MQFRVTNCSPVLSLGLKQVDEGLKLMGFQDWKVRNCLAMSFLDLLIRQVELLDKLSSLAFRSSPAKPYGQLDLATFSQLGPNGYLLL